MVLVESICGDWISILDNEGDVLKRHERKKLIVNIAWLNYHRGKATGRFDLQYDPDLKFENFSTLDREIRFLIKDDKLLKRVPGRKGYFIPNNSHPPENLNSFLKERE